MKDFPTHCQRCSVDLRTTSSIMSRFSTETLCSDCEKRERVHPLYQEAHDRELEQVKAGNMNYPGIGSPPELYKPMTQAEVLAVAVNGKSEAEAFALAKDSSGTMIDLDTQHFVYRFDDGSTVSITKTSPAKAVVTFP